jgi:hypothetical protein
MDIVKFIKVTEPISGDVVEHAIIDHGDKTFTSMTKAEYDRRQAEQSTPIVINEAETI